MPRSTTVNTRLRILLDTTERLLRRQALRRVGKLLEKVHAADVAAVLELLPDEERGKVFDLLEGPERIAAILTELEPPIARALLAARSPTRFAPVFEQLGSDVTADLLAECDPEVRRQVLESLPHEDRAEVRELLAYPPESAGGRMVKDFFAVPETLTVAETLDRLAALGDDVEVAQYVYVLNDQGQLVGVASLREVVTADRDLPMEQVMDRGVQSVSPTTDQEDVAKAIIRYNWLAIPVVDDERRLLGVVTVDDIVDILREEATEDMLKMAGVGGSAEELLHVSPWRGFKTRFPWIMGSLLCYVAISGLVGEFERQLQRVVALAAFMPMIAGMAGNVGQQSATIVVRGLALGRVDVKRIGGVLWRQALAGLLLGMFYGVLVAITALAGHYHLPLLAAAVGISMMAAMTQGACVGTLIPLLLARFGFDPAVATGPLVTSFLDVLSFVTYLNIAALLLDLAALPPG